MTDNRVQLTTHCTDKGTDTRLGVVVVKFNRRITELPAVHSALEPQPKADQWIVVDNSPIEDLEAESFAAENGILYKWMGGNQGISKAFNAGMQLLDPSITHVCFLDQDTMGVTEFLRAARPSLQSPHDLWLPIVQTPLTILSPCRAVGPAFRPMKRVTFLPRSFSAINTGLIGRASVLRDLGFNESLFLDYVDHDLIRRARDRQLHFSLLSTIRLSQDFSRETDDVGRAVSRFRIFRADVFNFYKATPYAGWYPMLLTTWTALSLARRHRSTRPLSELTGAAS